MPPGRAARPLAASSVAPISLDMDAPCVLPRERASHPSDERLYAKPSYSAVRCVLEDPTSWSSSRCYGLRPSAHLRVRVHGVRVALRGARPERSRPRLPGLRRPERAEAVLRLRG